MKKSHAFTMIELVFVIVVLGILAAVAIPKFGPMVEDAKIAKGKSTISSIRSAIVTDRQSKLILGVSSFAGALDDASTAAGQELFDGNATVSILTYPIYASSEAGGWMKITTAAGKTASYRYYISNSRTVDFHYTSGDGKFDCDHSVADCVLLTK